MLKTMKFYICCLMIMFTTNVYSTEINCDVTDPINRVRGIIKNILLDNDKYVATRPGVIESQAPRATVVTCSDSRVQTTLLDQTPENDLFTIRNIGNQLSTCLGSVEYGVRRLNTPVLFIIGHTGCGAIHGALSEQDGLAQSIKDELKTIILPDNMKRLRQKFIELVKSEVKGEQPTQGIKKEDISLSKDTAARIEKGATEAVENECSIENVHEQVRKARYDIFSDYFKKDPQKNLIILGLICDVLNVYRQGVGRLYLVNVDGERNPDIFKNRPELSGIKYFILPRNLEHH